MYFNNYIFPTLLLLLLCSCQKKEEDKEVLIEINGKYLYKDDISKLLPEQYTANDSTEIVNAYIENWVKKVIIAEVAAKEISDSDLENINTQVEEYKLDLLINKYYNQLIQQNTTQEVSEQEILEYYQKHKKSFVLSETLSKVQFIQYPKEWEENLANKFSSGKEEDKAFLKNQAQQNNWNYCLEDTLWMTYFDALNRFPLPPSDNPSAYWKQNQIVTLSDDTYIYHIKIYNGLPKGGEGPLEYYKNIIKNTVINKRRVHLLENIEDSLYKVAKKRVNK